jgi:hypothetical protein
MMVATSTERAAWWRKRASSTRHRRVRPRATRSDRKGMGARPCCSASEPTTPRTISRYVTVPRKVPRMRWVVASERKRRNRRGVNCDEASCTVTIVMEDTTATMVASDEAMAVSISRLLVGVPGM